VTWPDSTTTGRAYNEELVDDRSLDSLEDDWFGHSDFVSELVTTVMKTRTPTSIALFGAWGSGKSGIANLLKKQLPGDPKQARFAVFDASKYAENPLRRHFISQVAHEIDIKENRFHRGLYESEDSNEVTFRVEEWGKVLRFASKATAVVLGIILAVAGVIAVVGGHNFLKTAWSSLLLLVPGTAFTAALAGAVVKLISHGFTVKRTRSAPSGDEEFERRFKDLVEAAKTERLVVFVDELDRCSPAQVASVLETLKTFLFVKGCVFVVAADQQVLEQALRDKVKQHTPEDAVNPYYSAGSAYLDKVFQHQLALPPVKPAALTRYALQLVENRAGVWQDIPRLDEAVSVLIPTHVSSPRHVKVLLNRFRVAYRLAVARAEQEQLDKNIAERATELAKLVCLQAEFPLFAEALTIDSRMPELVLTMADKKPLPDHLRPEVRVRVQRYVNHQAPVAELLVPTSDEDGKSTRGDEVARAHSQQLINYLRKTELVPGPGPDLVFLQSAGAAHGVDGIRAENLQRAAIDNNIDEVLRLVSDAPDGEGTGALLVLADVVREGQPGYEGRNAVTALLQGIEHSGVDLGEDADKLADAVAGHLGRADLEARDLGGALVLASACSRDIGPRLLEAVLADDAAVTDPDLGIRLVELADTVSEEQLSRLGKVTQAAITDDPDRAATALSEVTPQVASRLLRHVKELIEADRARRKAATADEDGAPAEFPIATAEALQSLVRGLVTPRPPLARQVAAAMLDLNETSLDDAVLPTMDGLAPVADSELLVQVLRTVPIRRTDEWAAWLSSLDPDAVAGEDGTRELLDRIVKVLWTREQDGENGTSVDEALEELSTVAARVPAGNSIVEDLGERVSVAATTEAAIEAQQRVLVAAQQFVDAGLVTKEAVAAAAMTGVTATLQAPVNQVPRPSDRLEVRREVRRRLTTFMPDASEDHLDAALHAVADTQWLTAGLRAAMSLSISTVLRHRRPETPSPVSMESLAEFVQEASDDQISDEVVGLWLAEFASDEDIVWDLIEPLVGRRLPQRIRTSLAVFVAKLDEDEHAAFIDRALDQAVGAGVDLSFFDAAKLSDTPEKRVADRLVELYGKATNLPTRKVVMDLWAKLGPSRPAVQRRLIEDIYIPLCGTGAGGFELALSHFGLVAGVTGIRNDVRAALRGGARGDQANKRLEKKFEGAGWRSKGKWFKKGKDL
jgi:hypothetical protein